MVPRGACLKGSCRGCEVIKILGETFHACHYARSMKANLLDNGVGYTLVSPAFARYDANIGLGRLFMRSVLLTCGYFNV